MARDPSPRICSMVQTLDDGDGVRVSVATLDERQAFILLLDGEESAAFQRTLAFDRDAVVLGLRDKIAEAEKLRQRAVDINEPLCRQRDAAHLSNGGQPARIVCLAEVVEPTMFACVAGFDLVDSSRRAVEMLRDNVRRAIPKGTDRGVINATNKLRLAIGDEPWPGGEPCDCDPPCGGDVAPETTTPTRGPGCAES